DEAFNGPKKDGGGKGGPTGGRPGGKGGMGGPMGGQPGGQDGGGPRAMFMQMMMGSQKAQGEGRNRVVADPSVKPPIVKANPLDLLTIRDLLEKELDTGYNDSNATIKMHFIKLAFANATDVAYVVQRVYAESMNQNNMLRGGGTFAQFGGFGIGAFRN